jgi:hypothetical protein
LCGDFVSHAAKDAAPLHWIYLSGKIVDAPMDELYSVRLHGAVFFRTVAGGDHVIERLARNSSTDFER